MKRVKIVVFVPVTDADKVRHALGEAGAGVIGEYSFCSYSVVGTGRFVPGKYAQPHIGAQGQLEKVQEERVEVVCDRSSARAVIDVMKAAHPYEEAAYDIYELLEESEL